MTVYSSCCPGGAGGASTYLSYARLALCAIPGWIVVLFVLGFGLGMIKTFASKLKAEWSIRNENGTVVDMIVRNFKLAR